jgi:hypothetical protein
MQRIQVNARKYGRFENRACDSSRAKCFRNDDEVLRGGYTRMHLAVMQASQAASDNALE